MAATTTTVGIVGVGVVGTAILAAATKQKRLKVNAYDKFKDDFPGIDEALRSDVVFVCVPTQTTKGVQNLEPLEETLTLLANIEAKGVVVVKSTVVPGTVQKLAERFPALRIVHNPEFLTEANANHDFYFQRSCLLSGTEEDCKAVERVTRAMCNTNIRFKSERQYEITELGKYMHNLFLAAKVEILNEFADAALHHGVEYLNVMRCAASQQLMGPSHLLVPGPDGKRGFGGMCFPKDLSAFIKHCDEQGIPVPALKAVQEMNLQRRPDVAEMT
jgi:UDPglucose 6-dehydrogenase